MAVNREPVKAGWYEAWGIILIALAIFLFLSLISYDSGDIGILQSPPNRPPSNFIGPMGAWIGFVIFMTFGVPGYLAPLALGVPGVWLWVRRDGRVLYKALLMLAILWIVAGLIELSPLVWMKGADRLNIGLPGGMGGYLLSDRLLMGLMGAVGAAIVLSALLLVGLVLLIEIHPRELAVGVWRFLKRRHEALSAWLERRGDERDAIEKEQRNVERQRRRLERTLGAKEKKEQRAEQLEAPLEASTPEPEPEPPPKPKPKPRRKPAKPEVSLDDLADEAGAPRAYRLPSLDLLDPLPKIGFKISKADIAAGARILEDTLAEFNIEAQVTDVEQGPVVTRYQVLPAPGIRVEKIASLSNNIALSMKARSIRVQAPIPGKGVVGIEVPNQQTKAVFLRELMESDVWEADKLALPMALGHDVSGGVLLGDLADMPHLLIAGATGSGKTVCMNSILAGLLMSRTPDQLRLMLVDPKIVEFSGYADLPHLVVPVITDPKKVALGLRWAIDEMEKRYKLFAKVGVRNIKGFNSRPKVEQTHLFGEADGGEDDKKKKKAPETLPYIVIIVDELADLMLAARAEIENSIARLAQLSRAVGIHMILATQRPSVNVITGTIKANFPARIAFQVAQRVDSRTILDAEGADKLLGKGDMLYLPPGSSKPMRAQGTLTRDHEINKIVDFLKSQGTPEYITAIKDKIEKKTTDLPELDDDDEMLEPAIEIIRQTKRASTSSLQRRLRIGYTRAARLMDLLEEKGVVGPPRGSDPREILIDMDGEIPSNADSGSEGPETYGEEEP